MNRAAGKDEFLLSESPILTTVPVFIFNSLFNMRLMHGKLYNAWKLLLCPWAQFGGGHGGRVPSIFSGGGDIICDVFYSNHWLYTVRKVIVLT